MDHEKTITNDQSNQVGAKKGDIVLYAPYEPLSLYPEINFDLPLQQWPAIILDIYPSNKADLIVFSIYGVENKSLISFSEKVQSNCWTWLKK